LRLAGKPFLSGAKRSFRLCPLLYSQPQSRRQGIDGHRACTRNRAHYTGRSSHELDTGVCSVTSRKATQEQASLALIGMAAPSGRVRGHQPLPRSPGHLSDQRRHPPWNRRRHPGLRRHRHGWCLPLPPPVSPASPELSRRVAPPARAPLDPPPAVYARVSLGQLPVTPPCRELPDLP
jgi:hypothetical protein